MKKLLLISLLFLGCKKDKNSNPNAGVSAVHGCVTCHTVYNIIEPNGSVDLYGQGDSTICNTPDSVLTAYIAKYNYKGPLINIIGNPNSTETITTTCK